MKSKKEWIIMLWFWYPQHYWKNLDLKRPPFMDGICHIRLKLRSHACGNEFQTMGVLEASPRRRCPKLKWMGVEEATLISVGLQGSLIFY